MFKPISCTPTNIQPGFRRFNFHDPHDQPLIKSWRCELTALSHAYNLYFIACNDTIHIYQPTFPKQELLSEQLFILSPPVSTPNLGSTGIDLDDPHSITRLHVDYLGREEILLVTCDDGDVIGYRVPEIFRAIESRKHLPINREVDIGDDVRVFLHKNVGASAWGIAVHREARLIAISANTHQVTVFAYALSNPSTFNSPASHFSLSDEDNADFPSPRRRDYVITLRASTNVPAITFDNNDPSGRWLMSSSINGQNHLWDISKPHQPARVLVLGHCVGVQDPSVMPWLCRCLNRTSVPHAAWAALFIDTRSCHQTSNLRDACGLGVSLGGPKHVHPCFWDITETSPRFSSRRSGPFAASWGQGDVTNDDLDDEGSIAMSLSESDEAHEDHEEYGSHDAVHLSVDSDEEEPHNHPPTQYPQSDAQFPYWQSEAPQLLNTPIVPATMSYQPLLIPSNTPLSTHLNQAIIASNEPEDSSSLSSFDGDPAQYEDPDATEDEPNSLPPPAPEPTRTTSKRPFCELSTSTSFDDHTHEPRPCIIVTKEEIYLFQRPFDSAGDFTDPVLVMRNPLFPPTRDMRGAAGPLPAHHRQCYAAQIPELGIFIVASPAGRVGIFSLTKVREDDGRVLYGFRMDHILPSVEENGETIIGDVWGRKLVGVAVGPVQGMLDRDQNDDDSDGSDEPARAGTRRWRLMMHYIDHTVYNYELGKYSGDRAPGLGDLVV